MFNNIWQCLKQKTVHITRKSQTQHNFVVLKLVDFSRQILHFNENFNKTIWKQMYTFTETVLFSKKELQREFYGGPYYREWKICIGKRVVHITPNMTWYNDMAIFNNLSPLQLNKYLNHLCRWIRFLFTQNFINCCNHLHYFANLLWTRLFSRNIFNEHFYRVPHFWPQRSHYALFTFENYFF